jgi:hypothetical protein
MPPNDPSLIRESLPDSYSIFYFKCGWRTFDFLVGTTTTEAAAPFAVFEGCAFQLQGS